MLRCPSIAALTVLIASPALADAVTYKGTLGKLPILVEFSEPVEDAETPFFGRYSYAGKGIDIPLNGQSVANGIFTLMEESPCIQTLCEAAFDAQAPLPKELEGAIWALDTTDDGETITGTWTEAGKTPLPIKLDYVGSRVLDEAYVTNPAALAEVPYSVFQGEDALSLDYDPYDLLRTDVPLTQLDETRWDKVAFRMVADPRTRFPFPRVTDLDGGDMTAINTALETRHRGMTLDGLSCEDRIYYGMGWTPMSGSSTGTYGGYVDEQVTVTYLSPTLISWTESGSLYCDGASPYNHADVTNLDVRTGKKLDLVRFFAGSTLSEYGWVPSQELINYVAKHRVIEDADFDAECGIAELIPTNLGVRFERGDVVVFTLQGLPSAIAACGDDLVSVPLADIPELLGPGAAEYFPVLAN